MNTPIRIAISAELSDEMSQALTIPHSIQIVNGQENGAMANLLSNTDVMVSGSYRSDWNRQDTPNAVRLLHAVGAGIDDIDLAALPAGCTVCNVYGHERGVAEQAFTHILALHKSLLRLDRNLRQGNWTPELPYIPELRHCNLLIIGLGHIGVELARWGNFLEMNVGAVTRNPSPERSAGLNLSRFGSFDDLDSFLPWADFVVVAIPAAPESIDLIDTAQLALMKPTACIVNVGRARVINERALYQALSERTIGGAGLDVWYQYPAAEDQIMQPSTMPFHELDNVILTAHKPTIETMEYRLKKIAQNIERFSRREKLDNVVYVTPDSLN